MVRATAVSRRRAGRRRCCRRRNARLTSKGCIVSSTTQGTLQSRWRKARLAVNSCITSGATQGTLQSRLCNTRLTPKSCIEAVAKGCTRAQAHTDGYGGFAGAGAGLDSAAGSALADLDFAAGLWKPRLTADGGNGRTFAHPLRRRLPSLSRRNTPELTTQAWSFVCWRHRFRLWFVEHGWRWRAGSPHSEPW